MPSQPQMSSHERWTVKCHSSQVCTHTHNVLILFYSISLGSCCQPKKKHLLNLSLFSLFQEENEKKEDKTKEKKEKKKKEKKDYPQSWLIPTIYKTFRGILIESAFFKLLQDLLAFASPQLLK